MTRFAAFLCLGAMLGLWLAQAAPAAAQEEPAAAPERSPADAVAAVEDYFNAIASLRADFTQTGPEGGLSQGVIHLRRPGRLRVEYAPPVPVLIVGDGVLIHYHDTELGQINDWFIYDTPLGALTREEVRFGEDLVVTAIKDRPGRLELTLVQKKDPGAGSLTLIFATGPLALRQWRVIDAQGLVTTVTLHDIETNIALRPELFVFDDPREKEPSPR